MVRFGFSLDIAKMSTLSVELQAVILDFKITSFSINRIQNCRLWMVFFIRGGLWHVGVALKSHKALRIMHLCYRKRKIGPRKLVLATIGPLTVGARDN